MAQNGFNRRSSNATRTYPGTATRLVGTPLVGSPSASSTSSSSGGRVGMGSVPAVFVRPLSRSQLVPVHGGGGPTGSGLDPRRPPSPPARPISLDQPRPNSERHRNLYLGAPLPSHPSVQSPSRRSSNSVSVSNSGRSSGKIRIDSSVTAAEQVRLPSNSRKPKQSSDNTNLSNSQERVVTTQPSKRGLLDPPPPESGKVTLAESSIVCPYCRKCRCEACGTPRPLPSRWICSKSIHCGPEPMLDYLTCLCCVKALFYHCGKNHEADGGVLCADKPCSCAPHRKFWRWGCMASMSLLLPCLCLYWPCKGCLCVVEKAYQRYHNNGCNCRTPDSANPRGVLESSEDEDHRPPTVALRPTTRKLVPVTAN